jgi:hypothetical protein
MRFAFERREVGGVMLDIGKQNAGKVRERCVFG